MTSHPSEDHAHSHQPAAPANGVADLHNHVPGNAQSNAAMSLFLKRLTNMKVSGQQEKAWWNQGQKIDHTGNSYGLANKGWTLFQDIALHKPSLFQKLDPDGQIRQAFHADETLPRLQVGHDHSDHKANTGYAMIATSPGAKSV